MKILVVLLLLPLFAHALEVDEKLTVRIIRTSESRKTLMINRGTEDGLVEGDHARFIVTAGIVARAVCVKIAPTRSVWSVYRLVNADFVVNDAVMTIKITPPVKITKDETQAIVQEDVPTKVATDPATLGIPLADGAQDITTEADLRDEADLRETEITTIVERNWEVFGNFNISGLSSTAKVDNGNSFKNSQATHHIGFGGELYAQNERAWYSRFSLLGSVDIMRLNAQSYSGEAVQNDVTEFSFGTNWHPGSMPSSVLTLIPFFHLSAHFGSVRSQYEHGFGVNNDVEDFDATGSTSGIALGFGYKFYTSKGFGARALVDYYTRNERFKRDDQIPSVQADRTVTGPRFMMGISYRW